MKELFMMEALDRAKIAFKKDEVPIGAVVIKNNEIIGYGQNRTIEKNSVFVHAEMEAIKMASQKIENYRLVGCDIYTTIEPCHLCAKAIIASRIENLFIGAREPKEGSIVSQDNFLEKSFHNHKTSYEIGILEDECKEIIQRFFKDKRQSS